VKALATLERVRRLQKTARVYRDLRQARTQRRQASSTSIEGTLDFLELRSPHLRRPEHFRLYAERLDRAIGGNVRIVFSAPPQHGKTEVTVHGLALAAIRHPELRHAYITYSAKRARTVSRKVRRLLADSGVVTTGTLDMIELPQGGQILFAGIDGGITGNPADGLVVIDDYLKNRKEADSSRRREVILDTTRDAVITRVHPGASIFVLATRWHPKDLSATLREEGWEYLNLPAIAEAGDPNGREVGEPLFQEMWPIEALEQKKREVGDFTWAALYQGRPRPKGGKVFHEPTYYSVLPTNYQIGLGTDLAYTAKTSADWSVLVKLLKEERPGKPLFYVAQVDRAQVDAPAFALTLKARSVTHKRPILWRASGTEKGAAQFIKNSGIPIVVKQPPGDKLVSATDVAAAWNDGRVLVPDPEVFPYPWLNPFLDCVGNFTGNGKEQDDDVDALGNAHASFKLGSAFGAGAPGGPRGGDRTV